LRLEEEFKEELDANRRHKFRGAVRSSYSTLMYSMDKKWNPYDRAYDKITAKNAGDFRMYDFTAIFASRNRLWKKVEKSTVKLACLNNIPFSDQERFFEVMRLKGLGEPISPPSENRILDKEE